MATAFIHSASVNFQAICKAHFEVYGHTVREGGPVDVAIIDLDHRPLPDVEARILVYISARDYQSGELPEHALFQLKPVDVDYLMERVIKILKQTV